MLRQKAITWFATFLGALVMCSGSAHATDIGGTISSTLTITEDSQLVDDVTCTVTGAPCISFGAPHVTLELNGFTITGQADLKTACNGGPPSSAFMPPATEDGIQVNAQTDVAIHGPGLVQQFRAAGIFLFNSTGVRVTGVTISTNCYSGILVNGGANHDLIGNLSVRNGNGSSACGGIWLNSGASRNRLRGNRLFGNGYAAQGKNFGIGLIGFASGPGAGAGPGNVIEENTAAGNANGIFVGPGVQGTVIRRNVLVGNPPVQVSVDHTSPGGWDIQNLSDDGANTFTHNVCLTSLNAPCPAVGPPLIE